MKSNILLSAILATPLIAVSASAGLYKGLDEEGNVVYSDRPFDNAKEFTPPSLTVVDAPKAKAEEKPADIQKTAEFKYTDFDIVSPTNNETIWNEPNISVSLNLKPSLNTADGHTIWLLLDGKTLVKDGQELTLQIGRADRGAHQLQGQIRDKNKKIVARTRAIVFHVKQTITQKN